MLTPPDPATMAVSDADATPTDAPDTDALAPPVSQPGDAPPSDAPPNATEHAETPPDEEPLPAATSDPVGDAVSMAGAGSAGDIEIEDDAAVRAGPADDVQPEPSAIDVSQAAQPEPVSIDAVAPATEVEAEPEAEPEPTSAPKALPDVAPTDESAPSATGTDAEPPIEAPPIAAPTTVAELVAATLRAAGVRLAFTVPGESFLPLLEALERADIRVVATRHEGAAAFAAEAYGQLTGRPAVCLGTRAVGAANLAIGIHTARADSAPMFVLVGQVPRAVRGREAFQEVDLVDTIGRLASWAVQIDEAGAAAGLLRGAAQRVHGGGPAEMEGGGRAAALRGEPANRVLGGRPGPVLVPRPEAVPDEPLPDGTRVPQVRPVPPRPEVDEVRRVLHALAGARRPVILAGGGVLRARCSNDLTRLAELLHVPVIASWRRADVMSNDHPLYLGMAGYFAAPTVRSRLDDADLVVVLGSRLNEITTFGYQVPRAGQRWIHVDVEPQRDAVGDRPAPEMVVEAD